MPDRSEETQAERIARLEEHVAHQANTIEELSDQLSEQWRVVEQLRTKLDRLTERFLVLEEGSLEAPAVTRPRGTPTSRPPPSPTSPRSRPSTAPHAIRLRFAVESAAHDLRRIAGRARLTAGPQLGFFGDKLLADLLQRRLPARRGRRIGVRAG